MDNRLQRYLSDHHASSGGALDLIKDLVGRVEDEEEKQFLNELKDTVEADQENLLILMDAAHLDQSLLLEMAGTLSAQVSRLKLAWEGLDPGKLGFMEAYEMLAVGIQGKRMLWLALGAVAEWFPEWRNVDFTRLEAAATAQRDALEAKLVRTAKSSLIDEERIALESDVVPA
jgi:hypothetical protein